MKKARLRYEKQTATAGVLCHSETANDGGTAQGEGVRGAAGKNKRMSRRRREMEHGIESG